MRPSAGVMISPSGVGVLEAEPSIEGVERQETLLPRDDMQSEGGVLAPFKNEGEPADGERAGGDGENGERGGAGEAEGDEKDGEIAGTDADKEVEKDGRGRPERYNAENGETERERDMAGRGRGRERCSSWWFWFFVVLLGAAEVLKGEKRRTGRLDGRSSGSDWKKIVVLTDLLRK